MSDLSANLALPYLAPSQAQKHVTHNEALQILDAVAQLVVLARDQSSPPAAPGAGARYIVAQAATGAWQGREGAVALWSGSGWIFLIPQTGWRAWCVTEQIEVVFITGQWQPAAGTVSLPQVGINATADAVNRLTVSAPATLLNHEGAGHQLKINKATVQDTASLLFQSGFSGRAEMGLSGTDAWSIKVSADGSAWLDALTIDPLSGLAGGTAIQSTPADTASGRLMPVGAFGLGGQAVRVTPAALNLVTASGLYQLDGVITGRFDNGTRFLHLQGGVGQATQLGFRQGSDSVQWRRQTGGVWQNWQEVFSRAQVLGTVSQLAGVPTGALIEQGSNANGSYIRFADGTQICWQSHTHLAVPFVSSGGMDRSASFASVNWSAAFHTAASVEVTSDFRGLNTTSLWGSTAGSTVHVAACDSYRFIRSTGSGAPDCRVSFVGIGRWY